MNMSSTMKKFLAATAGNWEQEKEEAKKSSFSELPDGQYICRVTGADLVETNSGRPAITWDYTVLEGEEKGTSVTAYRMLDTENALQWAGRELLTYGVDIDDVSWNPKEAKDDNFIVNVLKAIAAERPVVMVQVKDTFKNLRRLITDYEDEDEPESEPEPEPEPTPKTGKGKKPKPAPEPEPEPEEEESEEEEDEVEEEDELTPAIGMKVRFEFKGKTMDGVIAAIYAEENKISVLSGGTKYKAKAENVQIIDGETD